jgi:protease-4
VKHAASRIKAGDDYQVVGPEREPDALKELLKNLGGKSRKLAKPGPVDGLVDAFRHQLDLLTSLNDPQGVYARLPFELELK